MKLQPIFLAIISYSCNATILIKFGQVPSHYQEHWRKGSTAADPFENLKLAERQALCDVAINARQFMLKYPSWYYSGRSGRPISALTTWDPPDIVSRGITNYQRSVPSPSDPDPECLKYQPYSVKLHADPKYAHVNALRCVNTMNVKWYLTFGWIHEFMYLLENGQCRKAPSLLVTGIFEPSAIVANRPAKYFRKQFRTSAAVMTRTFCRLGIDNTLRLCSAVFDALNKDITAQKNYVEKYRRFCSSKKVKVSDSVQVKANVVRCRILSEEEREEETSTKTTQFFLLADSGESHAVFVLYEGGEHGLELGARVTRIGALVDPVNSKWEKRRETCRDEESSKAGKLKKPAERETESEDKNDGKVVRRPRSKRKARRRFDFNDSKVEKYFESTASTTTGKQRKILHGEKVATAKREGASTGRKNITSEGPNRIERSQSKVEEGDGE